MFVNENSNMYGHEEKKERKKVIKMKDMFEIPKGQTKKIEKKEATINKKLDKEKQALPNGKADRDAAVTASDGGRLNRLRDTRISELKKNIHTKKPMIKA